MLRKFRKLIPYRGVPVLMYHQIDTLDAQQDPHGLSLPADGFAHQLARLAAKGLRGATLDEVLDHRAAPRRAVAITFDDGYEDNYSAALPLLQHYGYTATIFIATGWVGTTRPGAGGYAPRYLSWPQIREMAAHGIQFASHTVNHADLPTLSATQARAELLHSRQELEQQLGCAIRHVAYPYGRYNDTVQQLAAEIGYDSGWAAGASARGRYEMERFCMGTAYQRSFSWQIHSLGSWLRGLRLPIA